MSSLTDAASSKNSNSFLTRLGLRFDPVWYLTGKDGGFADKFHNNAGDFLNKQMSWWAKRDPGIKLERKYGPSAWSKEVRGVSDWAQAKPADTTALVLGAIAGGAALGGAAGGAGGGAGGGAAGASGGAIPGTVGFNAAGGGFTGGGAVGFGAGGMGSSSIPGTVGLNLGAGGAGGATMGSGAGGLAASGGWASQMNGLLGKANEYGGLLGGGGGGGGGGGQSPGMQVPNLLGYQPPGPLTGTLLEQIEAMNRRGY